MTAACNITGKEGLTALFLAFSLSFALFVQLSEGSDKPLETKKPVTITATTLTADNKAHTAVFEGTVIAKTDDMIIHSDRMTAYYSEAGAIIKIDAEGHVKLTTGEKVITSDMATYLAEGEKLIFTGQPRAVEGTSMITGTKMIYLIKEDRSLVENSRVFIEGGNKKSR